MDDANRGVHATGSIFQVHVAGDLHASITAAGHVGLIKVDGMVQRDGFSDETIVLGNTGSSVDLISVAGGIAWDDFREGFEVILRSPERIEEIFVGYGGTLGAAMGGWIDTPEVGRVILDGRATVDFEFDNFERFEVHGDWFGHIQTGLNSLDGDGLFIVGTASRESSAFSRALAAR